MLNSIRTRKLAAESLETRQLLHGGGFGGILGPPTVDEYVDAVFERYDATEDGLLNEADELSERVQERLAGADSDGDGGVTVDELTEFYETSRVSQLLGIGDSSGHHRLGGRAEAADRVDLAIGVVDDDGEGDIDQSEVSVGLWEELSAADTDGDGSLSSDELLALVVSIDAERQAARIADAVTAIFERYDEDGDAAIGVSEVSERQWNRLSDADGDGNDSISQVELTQFVTDQVAQGEASGGFFSHGHVGRHFGRGRR
jgi:Ca2+-binding EF-hand superfamily protein